LLVVVLPTIAERRGDTWPLLPLRPVPNAVAGPADPHPAAIFYNPAALGPLRGVHGWFDAGGRVQLGTIARDGGPGAGTSTPITSPAVDGFLGATWDLFTDRVTLGIGMLTPFNELTQYSASAATRYQAIWQRGATLEEIVAVGIRISSRLYIGASANFAQSWIDYRYTRDLAPAGGSAGIDQPSALCGGMPCGLENPNAAQDVRLRGFGWGIGFSVGLLARPVDRLWLALSYVSHVFDPFRGVDLPLGDSAGASVGRAPGTADPGCGGPCNGRVLVSVLVPDILMFGVRIETTPRLEIEGTTRWVHYGGRNALDVYAQGGDLDRLGKADPRAAFPGQTRFDRGWHDAWSLGASFRVRVGDKLRIAPSITYESSAIETEKASAANLEGEKLDLALTLEWRPRAHVVVGAHLGGTTYFVGHAGEAFDPRAEATCVDDKFKLPSCEKYVAGDALPSASGRYTMGTLHAGFALGLEY
jgi:long-subunit fatty acid transport protein